MGQINKIPLGYLNMLGSQTGGKNPFFAAEQVNPTVEMSPFYHAQAMSVSTDVLVGVAVGDQVIRTVPDNEAWMLYGWGFSYIALSAGNKQYFRLDLSRLPRSSTTTLNHFLAILRHENVLAVGDLTGSSIYFDNPIPLTAGSQLVTTLASRNGNITHTISYLYAKFTA